VPAMQPTSRLSLKETTRFRKAVGEKQKLPLWRVSVSPSASAQMEQGDSRFTDFLEISRFWILIEMCRHFRFWFMSATRMDISHEDIRKFLIISVSDFSMFAIGYELRPKQKT